MDSRRETGAIGEKLSVEFLKKRGYKIVSSNYRTTKGELDIIAKKKECLVFVEVRTKTNLAFGTPEESITPAKMQKLRAMAHNYINTLEKVPELWRIDFVAVELDERKNLRRIELIENAVGD